jgi:hypothetical protein
MPLHYIFQGLDLFRPAVAANVVSVDIERWMVNKQQCWAIRLVAERLVEPGLAFFAKASLALAD